MRPAVDNPMMNPRTLQETVGDWVQDQEDRAEEFLGALEMLSGSGLTLGTHGIKEDYSNKKNKERKRKREETR